MSLCGTHYIEMQRQVEALRGCRLPMHPSDAHLQFPIKRLLG